MISTEEELKQDVLGLKLRSCVPVNEVTWPQHERTQAWARMHPRLSLYLFTAPQEGPLSQVWQVGQTKTDMDPESAHGRLQGGGSRSSIARHPGKCAAKFRNPRGPLQLFPAGRRLYLVRNLVHETTTFRTTSPDSCTGEVATMATPAQIEANRKNAKRSTGPKSASGKKKASLNSYKHGMNARTIMPVLPQEDAAELNERIQQTIVAMQPRTPMEQDLVERAVRLSADIDRAERIGTAHLAHRVRKATILDPKEASAPRSARSTSSAPSSSIRPRSARGIRMPRPTIIRR